MHRPQPAFPEVPGEKYGEERSPRLWQLCCGVGGESEGGGGQLDGCCGVHAGSVLGPGYAEGSARGKESSEACKFRTVSAQVVEVQYFDGIS